MPQSLTVILGKAVRSVARMRGGGSALPGLFVERISPSFVPNTLAQLPKGVVIISGTNGKTTTTKMVVSILESQGLRVFTNRTGSNFSRGVAAALLAEVDTRGTLTADIAVLELDEAHAVKFVEHVKPRYSLLLNVMRDQLDRFGEIDATARMLEKIALATTETVVMNREDNRVYSIAAKLPTATTKHFFGLSPQLRHFFPNDDDLHVLSKDADSITSANVAAKSVATAPLAKVGKKTAKTPVKSEKSSDVMLTEFAGNRARFSLGEESIVVPLQIQGIYNIFNGAAALALVRAILPDIPATKLVKALSHVTPAFGRGEQIIIGGQPLELFLVKNPSGFRLSLRSFDPSGVATMIAINDNYADGRDMSWLWDVDFTSLASEAVSVTGVRAYDMALRLQYDEVPVETVEPKLEQALRDFISNHPSQPKRIYCTYTAMLALRKELSKITEMEVIA